MSGRLKQALDLIEQEAEAPIYALERLRQALADDGSAGPDEAKRLRTLDASGEGKAFGAGWSAFFAGALRAGPQTA